MGFNRPPAERIHEECDDFGYPLAPEVPPCGCGKPAKYDLRKVGEQDSVFACNPHGRCLTYDELVQARGREYWRLQAAEEALRHYADESNWELDIYGGTGTTLYRDRDNNNGYEKAQEYFKKTEVQRGE